MGFLRSCPYALLMSREVYTVWSAHRWFDKCSFFQRFPNPSASLVHAVESWNAGLQQAESDVISEMEAKRK